MKEKHARELPYRAKQLALEQAVKAIQDAEAIEEAERFPDEDYLFRLQLLQEEIQSLHEQAPGIRPSIHITRK